MLANSPVAADGTARDRQRPQRPVVGDTAAGEPALVTVNRAICNRQRPIVRDATTITRREGIVYTGIV
jgi:hypothetical protein